VTAGTAASPYRPRMTSPMTTEGVAGRALPWDLRRLQPTRIAIVLGRTLWRGDRALAELRWAGITLAAMAALAIVAKLIDPDEVRFDRAIVLNLVFAGLAVTAGWSSLGPRLMARQGARWLIGPFVVAVAMVATGPIDVVTLALPAAAPLVILALSYAAITPGYPIAASMITLAWTAVGVAHAAAIAAVAPAELVSDAYLVHGTVVLMSATGLYVVVRIASEAEARAVRLASRHRARVDALETLEHIVRRFDGTRSVAEIMPSVVDDIATGFDIPLVSIYLPISPTRLSMVGVAGYHSPFHEIDVGLGIIGRAASTLQTQFVPDVLADPDYRAARDDVRSEVATPIVHAGQLGGVVNFEGTLRHPIGSGQVAVAEMLARSIAAALHAGRLADERRDRMHAIERVLEVSRGLVGDLDRERTTRSVVEAAADLLAADTVFIAARDGTGAFRVQFEAVGGDATVGAADGRVLDARDDVAFEAVELGAPVTERTTMALPIQIDGQVAAVLVARRPDDGAEFAEVERRIADLLATQVAVALRNADRHSTMRDAAVRDPLTGLLNRRYFDEAVETAFATARRAGVALSLIVLDLDRFSAVNNEHGHAVGDAVLRGVARAMVDSVRVGDTVARFGGEEFVIVAPSADTAEAVVIAERIRAAVAAVSVPLESAALSITVSAGVASLTEDELDGKALFRAADSALLAAKRAGRDRVVAV
jgi:diguanylate cyclase (GGDEF)-like protein